MSQIFISHVEEDADVALEIALGLEEAGYTTWLYEIDSIPGISYLIQTTQAIDEAQAVVLVISPNALASHQVTGEVVRAHEGAKRFVPVLRDITHAEFQKRQPEWRAAVGAAASISLSEEGLADVIAHIASGLKTMGIHPKSEIDAKRVERIRKRLEKLQARGMAAEEEQAARGMEAALPGKPAAAVKRAALRKPIKGKVSNWWWALPVLMGFIGGIISWAINRGANRRKATNMLVFGILFTAIWLVPLFVFYIPMNCTPPIPMPTPTPTQIPTPTPTPTPTPSLVLFSDDFSDPSSGWSTGSSEVGSVYYEGGWLHITNDGSSGYYKVSQANQYFGDFALDVDTKLVEGSSETYQMIGFRAVDFENYYNIGINTAGEYYISKWAQGEFTNLISGIVYSSTIHTGIGETNHIHIECLGDSISLSVNGHVLAVVTDDSHTAGEIGVGCDAPVDEFSEVAFDNIVVTAP